MILIKDALNLELIYKVELRYLNPIEQDETIILRDAIKYKNIEEMF